MLGESPRSDGGCSGPEGFVHNPQQSLGIEDKPLQRQSDSFYHGAGSELTVAPHHSSYRAPRVTDQGTQQTHVSDCVTMLVTLGWCCAAL